jgi:hypothetical protein
MDNVETSAISMLIVRLTSPEAGSDTVGKAGAWLTPRAAERLRSCVTGEREDDADEPVAADERDWETALLAWLLRHCQHRAPAN